MSKTAVRWMMGLASLGAGVPPALALEHLMAVQEVFPGTPAQPTAQYVMLEMTSAGQTLLNGTFIEVQDGSGAVLGRFGTFDHTMANGGAGCSYPNCPSIVIGTSAAATLLGFSFDQLIDAQAGRVPLSPAGGRVCFKDSANRAIDCMAWGAFTGANTIPTPTVNGCDADFGAPAVVLSPGFAMTRKLFNCVSKTNSTDFENRFPHPIANNGANSNTDSDNDTLINILDCADADSSALYSPFETRGLTVSDPPTSIAWGSQTALSGVSTVYDILTGGITALRTDQSFTAATCLLAGAPGASTPDPGGVPSLGDGRYYLVRARNACGPGTYGDSTKVPDPRDFLDDQLGGPACP